MLASSRIACDPASHSHHLPAARCRHPQATIASDAKVQLIELLAEVLKAAPKLEAAGSPAADRARALFLRGRALPYTSTSPPPLLHAA